MSKRFTDEERVAAVKKYESGYTAESVSTEYGISRSTLYTWRKQLQPDDRGQIPRKQYLMEQELQRLRIENQIYRESGCCPTSPLDSRIEAIHRLKNQYSIHILCRILDVNRATFYHHEFRSPEITQLEEGDALLKPLILEIFQNSSGRFGARRIRVKLLQAGHVVSERRVSRLMKELKISSKGPSPRVNSANDRQYQYYPNKLKRKFLSAAPNLTWVSDITYALVGHDFLYLCVVIDLYSRKVVSYRISEHIDTALVKQAFLDAFHTRGAPENLTFHSDQGTQYTSFEFRQLLKKLGVIQSFSAPGSPHDNAVAESFFASIKKEDFRRNFYKTEDEFQDAVAKYIEFYNDYRPHQRLGSLTPNQAEAEYYEALFEAESTVQVKSENNSEE